LGGDELPNRSSAPEDRIAVGNRLLSLENVSVWLADGFVILADINWQVRSGEHWAVLGPNGAGKTTLFTVATARRYPSRGTVEVLGRRFGETSMLELREQISIVDPQMRMYDWFTLEEVVLTGITGTIQPQPDRYSDEDRMRARELLEQFGCHDMADREIQSCSHGERQRARIARALMTRPRLLVLDEPAGGLDLPAREALIASLTELERSNPGVASMIISHHLEELPPSTTHALLLREGRVVSAGPVDSVLTDECVTATFGIPVHVRRADGRWSARAVANWR
jgi:iron complex transport system ATP-binding protein